MSPVECEAPPPDAQKVAIGLTGELVPPSTTNGAMLSLHTGHKSNGHQRLTASRELTSAELTKLLWALRN